MIRLQYHQTLQQRANRFTNHEVLRERGVPLPPTFNYAAVQAKKCSKAIEHLMKSDAFTYKNWQPHSESGSGKFKEDLGGKSG